MNCVTACLCRIRKNNKTHTVGVWKSCWPSSLLNFSQTNILFSTVPLSPLQLSFIELLLFSLCRLKKAINANSNYRTPQQDPEHVWGFFFIVIIVCALQTEAVERVEKRWVGGMGRNWNVLGQQHHPKVSHRTHCQQPSNITHWLIMLEERRWQRQPWSRRMGEARSW